MNNVLSNTRRMSKNHKMQVFRIATHCISTTILTRHPADLQMWFCRWKIHTKKFSWIMYLLWILQFSSRSCNNVKVYGHHFLVGSKININRLQCYFRRVVILFSTTNTCHFLLVMSLTVISFGFSILGPYANPHITV